MFLYTNISLLIQPVSNLNNVAFFPGAHRHNLDECFGVFFNFFYAVYLTESEGVPNFDGVSAN